MTHAEDLEMVRDAVAWHEYGSQDERRRKAEPALDRITQHHAELVEALRNALSVIERSRVDAHDRDWAKEVVNRARTALSHAGNEDYSDSYVDEDGTIRRIRDDYERVPDAENGGES